MRIQYTSGYVGINQSSPAYWLDVNGSARVTGGITTPSFSSLNNTSYFDGKVSQLVNDNNYTTSGSNISQFNNDSGYLKNGAAVNFSQLTLNTPYNTIYTNNSQPGALAMYNTSGTAIEIQYYNNSVEWAAGIGSGTSSSYPNDYGIWTNSSSLGVVLELSAANGYCTMRKGYGTSDARRKQDVRDLTVGMDLIKRLRPVEFRWKEGEDRSKSWGLIAQEVQAEIPEDSAVVQEAGDGFLSLAYQDLIAPLIKAMQEQQAVLDVLQKKVTALEIESMKLPSTNSHAILK
eukprot:jgi/Astpho2/8010/fgenesh1_pg.00120_%23_7_t